MSRRTGELLFDKIRPSEIAGQAAASEIPARSEVAIVRPAPAASKPVVVQPTRAGVEQPSPPPGARERGSGEKLSPVMRVEGGRVTLSLTSSTSGVSLFAVILVLGASFLLGRSTGLRIGREEGFKQGRDSFSADVADEITWAREKAPRQDIVSSILTDKRATPPEAPSPSTPPKSPAAKPEVAENRNPAADVAWVDGHNYIVVQEFEPSAKSDAEAARDFLLESGLPTAVVTLQGGRHRLITIEGFNFKESAQRQRADLLKKRISEAGARFLAAGGRYKLEGYYAAYKGGW